MISLLAISSLLIASNLGMTIAKDGDFQNVSREFSPQETLYVRVLASNPGTDKKEVTLRDGQYNVLESYTFERSGFGPYTFIRSFRAPQDAGFYSIESRIVTSSSSEVDVKTIKVGKPTSANIKIQSKITPKPQVKAFEEKITPSPTIAPTPTPDSPQPTLPPKSPGSFFKEIGAFFSSIFGWIFRSF